MRHLILVSKTPIVVQIFTLVCKKLNIKLEVLNEPQIDHKVDIIVCDKNFIDDRFSVFKTYAKRMGAITNEKLSFEAANDFVIPSPFLPSQLEIIIDEQIQEIIKKQNAKTYVKNIQIQDDEEDENLYKQMGYKDKQRDPAIDYLDTLADSIASDLEEENDESIVSFTTLDAPKGGILDDGELSKLESMINISNDVNSVKSSDFDFDDEPKQEWVELSDIIDQAINEVNLQYKDVTFEDNSKKTVNLLLNNYTMSELEPLLSLLDQDLIDLLAEGEEVILKLKLESNNE